MEVPYPGILIVTLPGHCQTWRYHTLEFLSSHCQVAVRHGDTSKRTIYDPHSSLNQLTKTLPQFEDSHESKANIIKSEIPNTQRFQKKILALLEEVRSINMALRTRLPVPSPPNCPSVTFSCGARYCCVRCLGTQHETRYTTVF
uniref:Uncharacterized protein n=1 Tax=Oncorhynchus mykiss TaxID=8022 RepID=A0A8C7TXE1_ONCMY